MVGIAAIGVGAQWLAWRLRLPSILLLLTAGLLIGPVTGWIDPDAAMGDYLFPFVSLAVALVLFEGGLTLRFRELKGLSGVLARLVSVGVLVSWVVSAVAAHWVLGMPWTLSVLLGALLTVSGPTVVGPLLNHVRPHGRIGKLVKWEGIVVDPVGAILAALVFEALIHGEASGTVSGAFLGLAKTVAVGGVLGALGGYSTLWILRRHLAPESLQNPVVLALVLVTFAVCNGLQHEAGILGVTVMGIMMANQRDVRVRHIIEFKENLRVLLISTLFLLLAARVEREDLLASLDLRALGFVLVLLLIGRPLSVEASSVGSDLERRERVFLWVMAPRGIVAAAVSGLFAIRLEAEGFEGAGQLATVTFLVIIATVLVYGLSAAPIARRLDLARSDPQGVIFVGAHSWVREIALALVASGIDVLLVDRQRRSIVKARLAGLKVWYGSVLDEDLVEEEDLSPYGSVVATTANDQLNTLGALHFAESMGRVNLYQLPHQDEEGDRDTVHGGEHAVRTAFHGDATHHELADRFALGSEIKRTRLTEEYGFDRFLEQYGDDAWPLFGIDEAGKLQVFTEGSGDTPKVGQTLIALVPPAGTHPEAEGAASGPSVDGPVQSPDPG